MTDRPIFVGIATSGRREVLTETLKELARQVRRPDRIIVCPAASDDFDGETAAMLPFPITAVTSPQGTCHQRNAILDALHDVTDGILIFFDDDFFPLPRYLAEAEALFENGCDIVVASGLVLADGAPGPGLSVEEARAIIGRAGEHDADRQPAPLYNGYGCNMAVRLSVINRHAIRFDEDLPLYAWLEDVDMSRRMAAHGRIVSCAAMRGVHLGTKRGRSSGIRFGYSQIANPWYLLKKRTMRADRALIQAARNIAANAAGAVKPEPWVDRKGRLYGNALALRDLCLGRIHPRNILKYK
ncbi:MAG: glycosyltransferase family 2 protein [Phreatobacter sp.]